MPDKKLKIDKELEEALKDIVKDCEREDHEWRKVKIKEWKKNEEFWEGIQYIFWSEAEETWLSPNSGEWINQLTDEDREALGPMYDLVIDIYKAYGDSIIAALSAQIPAIRFVPDDADNTMDVLTSKTYSKVSELIQKHNKAKLLFMQALFIMFNEGNVLSYRYIKSDPKFGTYKVDKYEPMKQVIPGSFVCPSCGAQYDQDQVEQTDVSDEAICPNCGNELTKEPDQEEEVPMKVGEEILPKSRVIIDMMGPLQFKVPRFAKQSEEFDYCLIYKENNKSVTQYTFPDIADEIETESVASEDRISRTFYRDNEGEIKHLTTTTEAFLRPAAFYRCKKKDLRDKILNKFDKGVRVTLIGKQKIFADIMEETIEDRLSFGKASLSTYFHCSPIGRPLIPIQELKNQVGNLIVDTIEHQVPATYAESDTINFDDYGKFEPLPGMVYKAKARPGKSLADCFYTESKAGMSKDIPFFWNTLNQDGQFTVGAFPSIYGGPSEGKSRTFSEYAASRQMALQRLSIVWQFLVDWWIDTMHGCVKLYTTIVADDEYYSKYDSGSYIKIWIRRSEMQGNIGGCEPESADNFPVSVAQKKDLVQKLMEMNNPFINSVLYAPDNARTVQDVLSLNELKIPGDDQRTKQVLEINELIKGKPVNNPTPIGVVPIPMSGDGQPIVPDEDVDDDAVHIATIKSFLVDMSGIDLKQENPEGYANVIAHMKLHMMSLMKKTMTMNAQAPAPGQAPDTSQPKGQPQ